MTNQNGDALANKLDWRHKFVSWIVDSKLPTGASYPVGTPVSTITYLKVEGQAVGIGVPSAPALYLSQSHRAYKQSLELYQELASIPTDSDRSTPVAYDFFEAAITSILFGYMAIEVFANEQIPADYVYAQPLESGLYHPRGKEWIERNLSLSQKLDDILPEVLEIPSPKGIAIWGDYVHLRKLRNRAVHLKSSDLNHSKAWNMYPDSIWQQLIENLSQDYPATAKNMILHFHTKPDVHWLKNCPF